MGLSVQERKERVHNMADLFLGKIGATSPDARLLFYNIIDSVVEDAAELRENKAERSELKELISEIRSGFAAMDKRFEALQVQMDKRFEALQVQMDKRFEAVDKRFEAVDKRFDDFNRRFALLQWTMLIGFTMLTLLITVLRFVRQ